MLAWKHAVVVGTFTGCRAPSSFSRNEGIRRPAERDVMVQANLSHTAVRRGRNIEPAGLIRSRRHNILVSGPRLGFESPQGFGKVAVPLFSPHG